MVAPLIIAAGIGAGLKAGGGIYQGFQDKKALKRQARNLEEQARLEEEAAQFDALQAGLKFNDLLGEQKLSVGASGVEAEGSVLDIFAKTIRDKEQTMANILAEGRARAGALRDQARQAKKAGKRAIRNSIIGVIGGGAESAANIYGGTR